MKVYYKVLDSISGAKQNGHAVANQKNKLTLAVADKEIKEMLKCSKK